HPPACRARNGARFKTRSEMALAGSGEPQGVISAFSEADLTCLLEFVGPGEPQFRLKKREISIARGDVGSHSGRRDHCAEHAARCAAGASEWFLRLEGSGSPALHLHRVEKPAHVRILTLRSPMRTPIFPCSHRQKT